MSVAEIKQAIAALSSEEQAEVSAFFSGTGQTQNTKHSSSRAL
jgi:hypothetical protein